jgi:AIPR protein
MAKQDVDAVELEFGRWSSERAADLPQHVDPFEVFCAETLLKDYNLSDDDIMSGVIGRSLDGGCDAFFFLVGGKYVRDNAPIPEQRGMTAQLIFMQAKYHDGFSPLQVDRFDALTDDILDLSKPETNYRRTYHSKLLDLIRLFKSTYPRLHTPRLVIDYYYVTAADQQEGDDCQTSARNIIETANRHFNRAEVHPFHFINAAKLYNHLFERPRFQKNLQLAELMDGTEGYVGLAKLRDLFTFLKGDDGELIERIFDDNVRGFQLDTRVNESILRSLTTPNETPEFWLLNNGITILTPDAELLGGKVFRITDPQIVNGLQTSRQIFDYFKAGENIPNPDNRRIVVRVIENSDEKTREAIIRATNNQNPMPAEALYTTFRIHKQLESFFESKGFFYERRKGYWRDKRKPISKIITSLSLVQSVIAIMVGRPDDARGRPRDHINEAAKRYNLFGHDDYDDSRPMPAEVARFRPFDLSVYFLCWQIVKRVARFLETPRLRLDNAAKRNLLYYLARCAACAATDSAYCPPGKLLHIDVSVLTDDFLKKYLKIVRTIYRRYGGDDDAARNRKMGDALQRWALNTFPSTSDAEAEGVSA